MRKLANAELNRLSVAAYKDTTKTPIVLFLDNVRSLNNVGSSFRTADAFRIEKIFLGGITGTPPHREIHKTALGATESVDWVHVPNTLSTIIQLKAEGYFIVSVEQVEGSVALGEFEVSADRRYCLVFGNEVFGIDQKIVDASDAVIEIPQYGTKHSLNISVSIGMVVWDFFKSLKNSLC